MKKKSRISSSIHAATTGRINSQMPSIEAFAEKIAIAEREGRLGIAAVLRLAHLFGLRQLEAVMATAETLARWRVELESHGVIEIVHGTKCGSSRSTHPFDLAEAIAVVDASLDLARSQGGDLVTCWKGRPADSPLHASAIVRNWALRHGIDVYSARHVFAQRRYAALIATGRSHREALSIVSADLGHLAAPRGWVCCRNIRALISLANGEDTATTTQCPKN